MSSFAVTSRDSTQKLLLLKASAIAFLLSLWDQETGGFRFASHQPPTLMATSYSVLGLEFTQGLSQLSSEQKDAVISFLMSGLQTDGSFRDPLFRPEDISSDQHDLPYFQEETTTMCQQALDALLAPPPLPRDFPWKNVDDLICYFKSLPWINPWLDSNRVMFALSQLCHDAERHQKPELFPLVDAALDWLDAHQSPETGLWKGSHDVSLTNAMAATFHFTFYYGYRRRPLQYVERIIDSCLELQEKHGLFSGERLIGHTCLDYDALDLLAKASLATDYRSEDVQQCMKKAYEALLGLYNPTDGGFANVKEMFAPRKLGRKEKILRKLGLLHLLPSTQRVPASGTYSVCWRFLSCNQSFSNAFSTWFRLIGLHLATQRQWLNNPSTENFTFRRLPFLGYHDVLAVQSAHGIATSNPLVKKKIWQAQLDPQNLNVQALISVIIPAYNAEKFLAQTLTSLRAQTYPNWEGIIVNDGSTDQTGEIAQSWARSDSRFKVIEQPNGGLAKARNTALSVAKGDFIHCLDADDLIEPDFYQKVLRHLTTMESSAAPGKCAVCSYRRFVANGRIISSHLVPSAEAFEFDRLAQGNFGPPLLYIFERSILNFTGNFDESLKHCQDWDLWLRFARIGVNFIPIPQTWVWYRTGTSSLSRRYDTFVDAGATLLGRTCGEDARCNASILQKAPLTSESVKKNIIKLWHGNIQRTASIRSTEGMIKLFNWGKNQLPSDFWSNHSNYGLHLGFSWVEAAPELGREMESEIEQRLFYLNALNKFWTTALPKQITQDIFQDIAKVILSANQPLTIGDRLRLLNQLLFSNLLQKLSLNDFKILIKLMIGKPWKKIITKGGH